MTNFIIEDLETSRKISVGSSTDMTLEDAVKAVDTYDRLRRNRRGKRKARHGNQQDLAALYVIGKISRATYYNRLKEFGLRPEPPIWPKLD